MQANNQLNNPKFNNINKDTYIDELYLFIELKLNIFPNYLKNSCILQNLPHTIEGENNITENLCSFLISQEKGYSYTIEKEDNYEFQFINQAGGKGHRTYDLGVILANTKGSLGKILVIEAKRLPTPGKKREKEYVVGNLGGIERFKNEVHGQEISINKAIVIAYIQKETPNYWHKKVNEWIDEQIIERSNKQITWNNEDKLIENTTFSQPKITKYNSTHSRIKLKKINLTHYWLNLN